LVASGNVQYAGYCHAVMLMRIGLAYASHVLQDNHDPKIEFETNKQDQVKLGKKKMDSFFYITIEPIHKRK